MVRFSLASLPGRSGRRHAVRRPAHLKILIHRPAPGRVLVRTPDAPRLRPPAAGHKPVQDLVQAHPGAEPRDQALGVIRAVPPGAPDADQDDAAVRELAQAPRFAHAILTLELTPFVPYLFYRERQSMLSLDDIVAAAAGEERDALRRAMAEDLGATAARRDGPGFVRAARPADVARALGPRRRAARRISGAA